MTSSPPGAEREEGRAETMPAGEVKRRAQIGIVLMATRGVMARVIAFGGTIVLARLLAPEDFGLVALGLAIWQFGAMFSSGGIGATLIGRREPPERRELESLQGFQLLLTSIVVAATAAIASLVGGDAAVTTVVVAALPFAAIRSPAAIQLERELSYRRLASVEVAEQVAYYAWAITTVAAGFGVWGLASASIVMALTGSVLMMAATPIRVLRPRLDWGLLRPLIGFGLQFQGAGLVSVVRQQGVNVGTAALAGLSVLGIWTVAFRIIRTPSFLFEALWRVSYPANSRLIATGQDVKPAMLRATAMTAVAAGALFAALVGAAPSLIPEAFGQKWLDVLDVLPAAALGQVISVPIAVTAAGYLWARRDAATVLRANILGTVAFLGVAFALLGPLGVAGLGMGWLAGSLVRAVVFMGGMHRHLGTRLIRPIAVPVTAATVAAAAGWAISAHGTPSVAAAVLGGGVAEILFMVGIAGMRMEVLRDIWSLGANGVRGAVAVRS